MDGTDSHGWRRTILRLPSMPLVAQRVLELAHRRTADAAELHWAVQADPALVLALLRAARRVRAQTECGSLRAAIGRLGMPAALRVCLRFHLHDQYTVQDPDCIRHWRRAFLTTAYARAIARHLRRPDADQLQTAAALCHLDGLAAPAAQPPGLPELAGWLLRQGVCAPLSALVQASRESEARDAAACIALAGRMAEVWLHPDWKSRLAQTQALAEHLFGAVPDLCSWVFGVLGPQADEFEALLQIRPVNRRQTASLYAQAQLLLQR